MGIILVSMVSTILCYALQVAMNKCLQNLVYAWRASMYASCSRVLVSYPPILHAQSTPKLS